MRCPVCSEPLPRRTKSTTSEVCQSCAQVMLQNMTSQTLAELTRQSEDLPGRERGPTFTFPPEWREFRGVL